LFYAIHRAAINAVAFKRAASELSEGVVAKARCQRQKCVQQLRGTRKGGGVFDTSGKGKGNLWSEA